MPRPDLGGETIAESNDQSSCSANLQATQCQPPAALTCRSGGQLDGLDAVVIGAGPNGRVAANVLADAGWSLEVLEANDQPGGAVRSEALAHPDFVSDVFSAFYPMTAASPVIADLHLDEYGLRWTHALRCSPPAGRR